MKKDGRVVMKSYVPGDCGFDPLGLYEFYGQNRPVMDQMAAQRDPKVALALVEQNRALLPSAAAASTSAELAAPCVKC